MKIRFTLTPGRRYAMEMIGDEFGPMPRHYSAIRVDALHPSRMGQRVSELRFYHANHPEGMRTKRYTLHTLGRGKRFLLAKSMQHTPPRLLLVYDITAEWLQEHVRVKLPAGSDVDTWLNRHA